MHYGLVRGGLHHDQVHADKPKAASSTAAAAARAPFKILSTKDAGPAVRRKAETLPALELRAPLFPGCRVLVGVAGTEHRGVFERPPNDLQRQR